ncbi:MAG: SDR family oxidoreductase [Phototrophicaceae bacterium]
MQTIMITGSNRGIGLALVKEHLKLEDVHVFATCRNPQSASDLQALKSAYPDALSIVKLDVNNNLSIETAQATVASQTDHLDLLINNAGIFPRDAENTVLGQLERDEISHVVTTNSVSPVMVTQAFAGLLKQGNNPRVVMVSSQMGSIERAGSSGLSYRMSKAAMNMASKVLSQMLASDGITVITTHPGHVATDMGGASAPVTPEQSAAGLAKVAAKLTPQQTGKFYGYDGSELPW